ncbi:MAG: hypothetical protein JNL90_16000 [Planctomycetes bacterium]|nr:hypothetical protein [Planctomycetota bacterium]
MTSGGEPLHGATPPPPAVVAELQRARKYRDVASGVIERVAAEAWAIERRVDGAVKRAKRALHQLHSAFIQERELDAAEAAVATLEQQVAAARAAGAELAAAPIETCCRAVLRCHASTRERLEPMGALGRELHARVGAPRRLLDLGCGLHPFALPWLGMPREMEYHAREADGRMARLVGRLFASVGQAGSAEPLDLVAAAEGRAELPRADVAWLFKLLPTLERQRAGTAARLIERLIEVEVRVLVVSFPTRSLGARAKGMEEQYGRFADALFTSPRWRTDRFELGSELFVVARRAGE